MIKRFLISVFLFLIVITGICVIGLEKEVKDLLNKSVMNKRENKKEDNKKKNDTEELAKELYLGSGILLYEADDELVQLMMSENSEETGLAWIERQSQYMNLNKELYVEPGKIVYDLKEKRTAYLSFDDGPSKVTPTILDILKEKEITATFFIMASNITDDNKYLLNRMVEEGHTIGIHTYSHRSDDIYSSVKAYLEDFDKVYQAIYDITGVKATIFRFPWGSSNAYNQRIKKELHEEMTRRGFSFYDWNVSAEDSYGQTSAAVIKKNVIKDLDKFHSPIILMHDSSINENTAKVLAEILDKMKEKGFRFSTLEKREPYYFR